MLDCISLSWQREQPHLASYKTEESFLPIVRGVYQGESALWLQQEPIMLVKDRCRISKKS